ncbi:MAG TPA: hypothetical protein ENH62_13375 [Marinobacter sp.]|nr:hypothetical protein [Marinobacter sp.]
MAVTCQYKGGIAAFETLSTGVASGNADNVIRHDAINTNLALNATSTPAVSQVVWVNKALAGGAGTLDLTALTGANGAVDLTGLKVQAIKFKNPAGNAAMTIKFGVANPYNLLGASWTLILPAATTIASEIQFVCNEGAPDVAGAAKDIDLSGTGSEVLEVQIVAG